MQPYDAFQKQDLFDPVLVLIIALWKFLFFTKSELFIGFLLYVRGAVVVTTPQDVATMDARKSAKFIEKLGLPVIGVIENMSGMLCPHCGEEIDLFGKGGGKKIAEELNVPFLGSIPLDIEMRKAGDEGRPFIIRRGDSPTWKSVDKVMEELIRVTEG